jgi:hypothetical protein
VSGQARLHFPRELILHVTEGDTGVSVADVAVSLTLHARIKNDYHFAPALSNQSGSIVIERDWVVDSIEETRNFFLMDYQSSLDDCLPYVTIRVMSDEEINRAVDAAETFDGVKERMGVVPAISDLRRSSNRQFEPQELRLSLERPGSDVQVVSLRLSRRTRG